MKIDLYLLITDRIIAELEKGTVHWHKPWNCSSGAISRATGKPYSVLNQLLLPQAGEYVTYRQAIEEGHPVKKDEKASMVFFFKFLDEVDQETGEEKKIPLLRYYSVFHISQCEGMQPRFASSLPYRSDLKADERAESMLQHYIQRTGIKLQNQQSSQAYYNPVSDTIVLPEISQFTSLSEYYSTAFHESVHSTGHASRLNRITDGAYFGSEDYSKEELVAELGAAYLVNAAGLETKDSFSNSAAYIQGWLSALKNDKRFVVSAAGKAEKAVSFFLGKSVFERIG